MDVVLLLKVEGTSGLKVFHKSGISEENVWVRMHGDE